jgi:hypothetical protein
VTGFLEDHEAAMAVKIDEAGRDDAARGVERHGGVCRAIGIGWEQAHAVAFHDDAAGRPARPSRRRRCRR